MNAEPTVYVVDDDHGALQSVEALLSQHGYCVKCFDSAETFLQEVALESAGCVVTDVQMPCMDGMELQRMLNKAGSLLSVVVITGVADVPMTVKLMQRGAVRLLEKPYDHIDLLDAVSTAVAASRQRVTRETFVDSVKHRIEKLTEEEMEVMRMMLQDSLNKTIAKAIQKGMRTVDRRRQAVLDKMEVRSVPELATLLASAGIELK